MIINYFTILLFLYIFWYC